MSPGGVPREVCDHPANAFVYHFIGDVNLFHGRIHEGKIHMGQTDVTLAEQPADAAPVVAYVRPHDIEISRTPVPDAISSRILHISVAGGVAKIQLVRLDTNENVEAQITRQQYEKLKLRSGETVFIDLRNPHIFE